MVFPRLQLHGLFQSAYPVSNLTRRQIQTSQSHRLDKLCRTLFSMFL